MRGAPRRVDGNHAAIRDGLRKLGYWVLDLSQVGDGCADLLVIRKSDRRAMLLEVKDPSQPPNKRKLTSAEMAFALQCPSYAVVLTLDGAIAAMGASSNKPIAERM